MLYFKDFLNKKWKIPLIIHQSSKLVHFNSVIQKEGPYPMLFLGIPSFHTLYSCKFNTMIVGKQKKITSSLVINCIWTTQHKILPKEFGYLFITIILRDECMPVGHSHFAKLLQIFNAFPFNGMRRSFVYIIHPLYSSPIHRSTIHIYISHFALKKLCSIM